MSVTKKIRFEVFERDGYRCRYCGNGPPIAALVIDHIVPRSLDGGSEPANLATACSSCNSGKASRAAAPPPPQDDDRLQASGMTRREEVAIMTETTEDLWRYAAASECADPDEDMDLWDRLSQEAPVPERASIQKFVAALPFTEIQKMIDRVARKFGREMVDSPDGARLYFYKACHNMMRGRKS